MTDFRSVDLRHLKQTSKLNLGVPYMPICIMSLIIKSSQIHLSLQHRPRHQRQLELWVWSLCLSSCSLSLSDLSPPRATNSSEYSYCSTWLKGQQRAWHCLLTTFKWNNILLLPELLFLLLSFKKEPWIYWPISNVTNLGKKCTGGNIMTYCLLHLNHPWCKDYFLFHFNASFLYWR